MSLLPEDAEYFITMDAGAVLENITPETLNRLVGGIKDYMEANDNLKLKVLDASNEQKAELVPVLEEHGIDPEAVVWTTREAENAAVQTPQDEEEDGQQ